MFSAKRKLVLRLSIGVVMFAIGVALGARLGFTARNIFQVTLMYPAQIPILSLSVLIYRVK